jgi:hypothetical protein
MGMMNRLLLTPIIIRNWRTVASSHHEERQATELKGEKKLWLRHPRHTLRLSLSIR